MPTILSSSEEKGHALSSSKSMIVKQIKYVSSVNRKKNSRKSKYITKCLYYKYYFHSITFKIHKQEEYNACSLSSI